MAAPAFVINRLTIDTVTWTAVTPSHACTQVVIRQGGAANDIKVRTDQADSGTEHTIPSGVDFVINSNPGSFSTPFPAGDAVCYLQSVAGTGPAVCEFIR